MLTSKQLSRVKCRNQHQDTGNVVQRAESYIEKNVHFNRVCTAYAHVNIMSEKFEDTKDVSRRKTDNTIVKRQRQTIQ